MAGYNTNLASEFYVLSVLYRRGLDANLTLGNKKSVDITVVRGPADVITIDVKAVAKCMDWPISSKSVMNSERHFVALLCYNGHFADQTTHPDVWIVPYSALQSDQLTKVFRGDMTCVIRKRLIDFGGKYLNNWSALDAPVT